MKKIGIITIVKVYNYGAELQAYALQKKLELMGYDVEIIDYLFYKHKSHKTTKLSKPWINIGFERKVKELLYPIIYSLKTLFKRKQQQLLRYKFESFHKKNTSFSKVQYPSMNELYTAHLNYDIFIVGSDQVWNPWSNTSLDPYFLTFAPKGKKRISYASSFGVAELPLQATDKYKNRLNDLDSISVRESSGLEIVQKLTGRMAEHVVDPTMLLTRSEWEQIAVKPPINEPYILLYNVTKSDYATRFAKDLSNKRNLKIVKICTEAVREDKNSLVLSIPDAGPAEFLGLFIKSSLIITNSFHGTVFSIIFNRPFYTIIPASKTNTSRQLNLLEKFGLTDRTIYEYSSYPSKDFEIIDFDYANNMLISLREGSVKFLLSSIDTDEVPHTLR